LTSPLRYNPAFDGLRAIAALCVIASHCEVPWLAGGFYGVDLFFVLSGFLITWLLFDEHGATGRIDLPYFFLRRYLRLTPPLLAMLVVYLAVAPIAWPEFGTWSHVRDVLLTGTYVSDYARAFWGTPLVLQHSWSLGVEEHFYLLWPLAVLALLRLPARWRPVALFCLYIAATAWRMTCYGDETTWPETYYRFDTRMSGLILGALLATVLCRIERVPPRLANIAGAFAGGALILSLLTGRWHGPDSLEWTMTLAETAAAGLLIAASAPESWVSRSLSAPPLVAIGILSYGLYLWHYPAAVFFRERLPWYETVPMVLAIAFLAATLSHLTIERPLQGFRRSFKPQPSKQAADSDEADTLATPVSVTTRR
jgi:peptidoglycan/LPS O-acetylase OafA/YrhL